MLFFETVVRTYAYFRSRTHPAITQIASCDGRLAVTAILVVINVIIIMIVINNTEGSTVADTCSDSSPSSFPKTHCQSLIWNRHCIQRLDI